MKLYNILTKGIRTDSFYEILFYNYISNVAPSIHEYTGLLPYTFTSDGNDAIIDISGNTTQSGTPTPENPVDVQGVGMLDGGQYIIPMSSGGVTTNIELGDTLSTRQIKKMIFTGNEDWQVSAAWKKTNTSVFFYNQTDMENTVNNTKIYVMSDKFVATSRDGLYNGDTDMIAKTGSYAMTIRVSDNIATTAAAFKAWLALNPVTVYYVLETPTTGTINEPLMKIGDYVDTISGISLPTTVGTNTISCSTTVQPSEVYIRYTGG